MHQEIDERATGERRDELPLIRGRDELLLVRVLTWMFRSRIPDERELIPTATKDATVVVEAAEVVDG